MASRSSEATERAHRSVLSSAWWGASWTRPIVAADRPFCMEPNGEVSVQARRRGVHNEQADVLPGGGQVADSPARRRQRDGRARVRRSLQGVGGHRRPSSIGRDLRGRNRGDAAKARSWDLLTNLTTRLISHPGQSDITGSVRGRQVPRRGRITHPPGAWTTVRALLLRWVRYPNRA